MRVEVPGRNVPLTKSALLAHDNLDDRKEVVTLLERLPPMIRVGWMTWCCTQCVNNRGVHPEVKKETVELAGKARWDSAADQMLIRECYGDMWFLASQYALDVDAALKRLVVLARRFGRRR